jgi:fusion and transport protein UGO1
MSSFQREGPNPLRPYYIPPSVGLPADPITNTTSAQSYSSKHVPSTAKPGFGSSARDILSDLDYSDYLSDSSPSLVDVIKGLINQALWKYTSILLAQPFEVAKTVLQVHIAQNGSRSAAVAEDMRRQPHSYRDEMYNDVRDSC